MFCAKIYDFAQKQFSCTKMSSFAQSYRFCAKLYSCAHTLDEYLQHLCTRIAPATRSGTSPHTFTLTHIHTHTDPHTDTHTDTQTHRHTDTHTLTHTHTHPVTHPRPQRTHVPLDTVGSLTVVSLSLLRSCEAAQHYFATGQTFMFIVPLSSLLIVPFLLCSQTAYLHDHLPLPHVHQRKECLHSLRCVQSMRGMDSDPHM